MRTMLRVVTMLAMFQSLANAEKGKNVEATIVAHMTSHTCKHTMATKSFGKKDGEQVTFVEGGKRYTFYFSPDDPRLKLNSFLAIWVRTNGTRGQNSLVTFTDNKLDGTVDFGVLCGKRPRNRKNRFDSGIDISEGHQTKKRGLEHRNYYQRQFDLAIAAASRRLL